ncbi:MAG: xanthine dehydrogenase family protein subunit M [Sphingomonadales bacterium]
MYEFDYHRPANIDAAAAFLRDNEDAKLGAGGQTLIPTLRQRLAMPSDLVDIARLDDLKGMTEAGDTLLIGASVTHAEVASAAAVKRAIPALAYLAEQIGDPMVRHRGTLGGSIANNDPAADYPAAVLGLGATVHTHQREIAADDFFRGMFETALNADEIITKVSFPKPQAAGYAKFPNPASRYATVGVFVAQTGVGPRVAVTGAGPCVFRLPEFEAALGKSFDEEALAGLSVPADGLNSDMHASAEYRAHLVTVMAKRAVRMATRPHGRGAPVGA